MAASKKERGRGRPRKLGEHVATTLRVPTHLHAPLRLYAAAKRVSLNDLLINVIEDWWSSQRDRKDYERIVRRG